MARTLEQIRADRAKLDAEEQEALKSVSNDARSQVIEGLQLLYEAKSLPASIRDACTDKKGVFNPKRVFRMVR